MNDWNEQNLNTTSDTSATNAVSEPYRYKYENGEKSEDTRYHHYYYGTSSYDTYGTSQSQYTDSAQNTKKKKKKP